MNGYETASYPKAVFARWKEKPRHLGGATTPLGIPMAKSAATARSLLNLTDAQWVEMIDRLEKDRRREGPRGRDRRQKDSTRYPFNRRIALRLNHPGGGNDGFVVRTRNLSSGGIAIVHGGFLHSGASCHVAMARLDGQGVGIAAEATWCRLIGGKTHEIGLRFTHSIAIGDFIEPMQRARLARSSL